MKTLLIIGALYSSAFAVSVIEWTYGGAPFVSQFVNHDARIGFQAHKNGAGTNIDLWPTTGIYPPQDSLAEITLYRTRLNEFSTGFERFNISSMVDGGRNGAYRFGVERGGSGQFRDIVFCFENYTPGESNCPFLITPQGVFVSDDLGVTWRKL